MCLWLSHVDSDKYDSMINFTTRNNELAGPCTSKIVYVVEDGSLCVLLPSQNWQQILPNLN